jgi:O-methyltransferase involved in polyketide biosynthesis
VDNGSARWYNIDLPDTIAYRERFIAPAQRERNIAKSMFDYSWLDEIGTPAGGEVLVLAAGLFFYFHETELRDLTATICRRFPHGELFFEACSRSGMNIANKMVKRTGNAGAEMKFWVNDAASLKAWSPKITRTLTQPFFGDRYKDKRLAPFTRLLMWGADILKRTKFVSIQW